MVKIKKHLALNLATLFVALLLTSSLTLAARIISFYIIPTLSYTASNVVVIIISFVIYGIPSIYRRRMVENNRVTGTFPSEPGKEKFVFNVRETLIVAFLAVLCTIAMHLLRSVTLNFVYGFTGWSIPNPAPAGTHSSFLGLIIAAISLGFVCPIIEELYFRRMLFQGFRFLPQLALVTASTLLFALAHGNLNQAIFIIPLGVFCSVLFLRTNSIIYPAAIHIFVNITSLLGLDLDKHLFSHSYAIQLQDRAAAKIHGLFGALLLLLLATGAYYCFKALRPSSPERSQDVKAFLTGQGRGLYAVYTILYLVLCLSFGLLQFTLTRWGG